MSFFGPYQFGMGMDMNGEMVKCPFSSHSMSICKINPLEHIQEWQSMFTTLPAKDTLAFLSSLLALLALLGLKFFGKYSLYNFPQQETFRSLFYLKNFYIPHPLKVAFARGILNPKTF
jgi:hypothetical protein